MHWLDPDYLPKTTGTVSQFLLNPEGEIDGMILKGGKEVHFPPHMSKAIAKALSVGDKITVRGVKPREADIIAGVALDIESGDRILDKGPPEHHKQLKHGKKSQARAMDVSGVVKQTLHGPKGETRGVLLESGEIVRFPKHEAKRIASLLKPGAAFAAKGEGHVTAFGTVVHADEMGSPKKIKAIR